MVITKDFLKKNYFSEKNIELFEAEHPNGLDSSVVSLVKASEREIGFNVWLLWNTIPLSRSIERLGWRWMNTPSSKSERHRHIAVLSELLEAEYGG